MDLFKLCKHSKLPGHVVFVGLEKSAKLAAGNQKAIWFKSSRESEEKLQAVKQENVENNQIYLLARCATSVIG